MNITNYQSQRLSFLDLSSKIAYCAGGFYLLMTAYLDRLSFIETFETGEVFITKNYNHADYNSFGAYGAALLIIFFAYSINLYRKQMISQQNRVDTKSILKERIKIPTPEQTLPIERPLIIEDAPIITRPEQEKRSDETPLKQ